jgi:hypothetical protein
VWSHSGLTHTTRALFCLIVQVQKQKREVLMAAEEVSLISSKLMQTLRSIDPKHFQCGSIRRRKGTYPVLPSDSGSCMCMIAFD